MKASRHHSPLELLMIYKKYFVDYKQRILQEFMELKLYLSNTPIKSAILTELATIGLKSVKHKKKQPVIDFDSWKTYILLVDILHLIYDRKEHYNYTRMYSNRIIGEFKEQSSQQISDLKKIFDSCPLLRHMKPLLQSEYQEISSTILNKADDSQSNLLPTDSNTDLLTETNQVQLKKLNINKYFIPNQKQYPKTQRFLNSINKKRTEKYNQKREMIKMQLSQINNLGFVFKSDYLRSDQEYKEYNSMAELKELYCRGYELIKESY